MNDRDYGHLKSKILNLTGINLDYYKPQQMRRRLENYISRSPAPNVIHYCKLLESEPAAQEKLKNFLTINVSEFFRDQPQFASLKTKVIPQLLEGTGSLNIWSAGCSMGAEPYSIAMLLDEIAPSGQHRVLATDLDLTVLSQAKAGGPYTDADVKNVSRVHRLKHFTSNPEGHWLSERLKAMVSFRQHNLLDDAFNSGFDLIVCRNVVIYFSDEAKAILNRRFCDSLKVGGVMFIGGTETLLDALDLGFDRLCPSFYIKTGQDGQDKEGRRAADLASKRGHEPQILPARAA